MELEGCHYVIIVKFIVLLMAAFAVLIYLKTPQDNNIVPSHWAIVL